METTGQGRSGKVAALIVVALIFAGAAVYLEALRVQTSHADSQTIGNLLSQVSSLRSVNSALQAQLAGSANETLAPSTAEAIYANASRSVVTVQGDELVTVNTFFGPITTVQSVLGSGFAVQYGGQFYVVTNNHVVDGVSNITATFIDGNSYTAAVKGTDKLSDLAVLVVNAPASEFHPLKIFSTPGGVLVGETVYAIGNPFGLSGSMTTGIVSQVDRTITESGSNVSISDVVQFSAAINPGNSGGPLLDSTGAVVGITTAAVTNSQGLGFAIPSSTLARELSSLITLGGYSMHPYLGINGADMTYQLAQSTGANVTYGVLVQTVATGGPAAAAGVKGGDRTGTVEGSTYRLGGDVIVSVNGTRIVNSDALASYLEENTVAGQTLQLGVERGSTLLTLNVTLGSLP